MATVTQFAERKNFTQADETRPFAKGRLDVVNVGGHTIGRAVFEPGWKWSECVKPIAKTESCQAAHLGYVISGRMTVVTDDGKTLDFGPGDAMSLPPGHDAWIVGNEPCVVVDFVGFENYAKRT
ncbi:cupin [Vulcanimicrobium alpinum]|uniref:Cupin n=1 Tax=Vulcanimicrobium alpinum TaxID=3016050 RepID=A0AAN1XTW4_UNVUL|nr:cupin domain-containing protein [Vulcanimicrobium alpinum]BDE05523.1 cupin [Vulcanimicrobium alpinum]